MTTTPPHTFLWVSAHPEPASLNGHLRRDAATHLQGRGHQVLQSDLYAMGWNPVVGPDAVLPRPSRFNPSDDVRRAYLTGGLAPDIVAEQEKLLAADAVVLQFPLWWYGMPAILKGWFDKVFHSGFAFGKDPATGRRLRFEQGPFAGKRAFVVVTLGDRPRSIGPRGKSGELQEMLFGLLHGTLAYTGMQVLEPLAVPSADFLDSHGYSQVRAQLRTRLDAFFTDEPIAYRPQFTGHYTPEWELNDHIRPGETGLSVHVLDPSEAAEARRRDAADWCYAGSSM